MVKLAIVIEGKKTIEFESGVKTNVEVVDGKLQLEVVGEGSVISDKSAVPPMNANNSPAPFEAFASSQYSFSFQPYRAFDGDPDTRWVANNRVENEWVGIFLGQQKKIVKYILFAPTTTSAGLTQMPRGWKIEGSNDGSLWVEIDQVFDNNPWKLSEKREYEIRYPGLYSYYRIYILSNHGSSLVNIPSIEFYEEIPSTIYSSNGVFTTPVLDFGAYVQEFKTISAIRNVKDGTDLKIYTSTSNDLINFSPFEEIDYGTGKITSPFGRYMRLRIEFYGRTLRSNVTLNNFSKDEASQFQKNEFVEFSNGLKIKTDYIDSMTQYNPWHEEGAVFIKTIENNEYIKIYSLKTSLSNE